MKHIRMLFFAVLFLISCGQNESKQEGNESTKSPDETNTVDSGNIALVPNTIDTITDKTDTVLVKKELPIVYFNNLTLPVELYEAETIEIPSDSILALAGIKVTVNEKSVSITTDSSTIPDEIIITKSKGSITVKQLGKVTTYPGNKVELEGSSVSIDGKVIVPEKTLTTLRIGLPRETPLKINGESQNINATVLLGNIEIDVTGNGNIKLSVISSASIKQKGASTFYADNIKYISSISLGDSSMATINKCDSIRSAIVNGRGLLQLPANTEISKEKITGNGDIVKK